MRRPTSVARRIATHRHLPRITTRNSPFSSFKRRHSILVSGSASGQILHADTGLSFWGGVDPTTGIIIDVHHPLHGECITGKVLAIPQSRGSCTGSQIILELLLAGTAPSAILLRERDEIVPLGAIVAEEMFSITPPPIVSLGADGFAQLAAGGFASVDADGRVLVSESPSDNLSIGGRLISSDASPLAAETPEVQLSGEDEAMLRGDRGIAAQVAMRVVTRCARLQNAAELVPVTQAHIDSCIHVGPASLAFAERFVEWSGKVMVPTTLNAVSVDLRQWERLGVLESEGKPASALAAAYLALGASESFTCAPYLLDGAPLHGEHIGWSESNAVVFANACLGARTQKYADLLDVCIALTGRAPLAGCHTDKGRLARLHLHVDTNNLYTGLLDETFFGSLGYLCGLEAEGHVPLITGLEEVAITRDQLKAFSAAFGTSSAAALFHIHGHTPEAEAAHRHIVLLRKTCSSEGIESRTLTSEGISGAYGTLGGGRASWQPPSSSSSAAAAASSSTSVQLVALGNPHFSFEECAKLATLLDGERKHDDVALTLTLGREVLAAAHEAGHAQEIERFGGQLVCDTCWCMLREPLVPPSASTVVTNSAKYAHYGPALVGRKVLYAGLEECVSAAVRGRVPDEGPKWLRVE